LGQLSSTPHLKSLEIHLTTAEVSREEGRAESMDITDFLLGKLSENSVQQLLFCGNFDADYFFDPKVVFEGLKANTSLSSFRYDGVLPI
jgi:hypothetical protein